MRSPMRPWLPSILLLAVLAPAVASAQGTLLSVEPPQGEPGTEVQVVITGDLDCVYAAQPEVTFSPAGPIVNEVLVTDTAVLDALLFIPADALPGPRDVSVEDDSFGVCTGTALFEIVCSSCGGGLLSVVPASAAAGDTLSAVITGEGTHFDETSVASFSGTGVQVGATTALSETSLRVALTLDALASPGLRDVQVTTGAEVATGPDLFEVLAVQLLVEPDTVAQGGVLAQVTVTGGGVDFTGATGAGLGEGVSVAGVTVLAPDQIVLDQVAADLDAVVGLRDLSVQLPAGARTFPDAFGVTQGAATRLVSVTPTRADRGHPGVEIAVVGEHTHFDRGDLRVGLVGDDNLALGLDVQDATHLSGHLALAVDALEGPRTFRVATDTGRCVWLAPPEIPCESVSLVDAFEVSAPGTILSVAPALIETGTEVDVALTAQDGGFVAGQTSLRLAPPDDIEVLSVSVIGPDSLSARLRVAAEASGTPRDVTTVSGLDVALGAAALDVLHPQLLRVTPSIVDIGRQDLFLRLECQDVPLDASAQVAITGDGLTVGAVGFDPGRPDELTLELDVAPAATPGFRDVSVTAGGVTVTLERGLRLRAPADDSGCAAAGGSCGGLALAVLLGLALLGRHRSRRADRRR